MMKAYRYEGGPGAFRLRDVTRPVPANDEILIKVEAAGLCRSDCHIVQGHNDSIVHHIPITLGHEVAGTVADVGSEVLSLQIGDRVAVGQITFPLAQFKIENAIGLGYDGGYSEYATSHISRVVRIPDNVPLSEAAVATDAIVTAYHAVVCSGGARKGITMGIIGLGGLGLNGVALADLKGAKVYGVDIDERKFPAALENGAIQCVASLDQLKQVAFDVVVDFAGVKQTVAGAIEHVKLGGLVVLVGLGAQSVSIPILDFVSRNITLKASCGASREDLIKVYDYISVGLLKVTLEEIPFSDIKKGLRRLEEGETLGRLWTDPSKI